MAFQSCCLVSRGSFPKVERSRVLSNPLLPYRLLTSVTSPTTPKGENPPLSTTQTKISKSLQLEQHFYPLSPLPTQKKSKSLSSPTSPLGHDAKKPFVQKVQDDRPASLRLCANQHTSRALPSLCLKSSNLY